MCLIENGNSYPSLDTFIRIAKVLEIDVNEFFRINSQELDPFRGAIIDIIKALDKRKLPLARDILTAVENNWLQKDGSYFFAFVEIKRAFE